MFRFVRRRFPPCNAFCRIERRRSGHLSRELSDGSTSARRVTSVRIAAGRATDRAPPGSPASNRPPVWHSLYAPGVYGRKSPTTSALRVVLLALGESSYPWSVPLLEPAGKSANHRPCSSQYDHSGTSSSILPEDRTGSDGTAAVQQGPPG
jgi:hypothetical protein